MQQPVPCRVRATGVRLYVVAPEAPPAPSSPALFDTWFLPLRAWARWCDAVLESERAALRLATLAAAHTLTRFSHRF